MNDWHAFLTRHGAQWSGDRLVAFADEPQFSTRAMIPMTEHQLLQVQGPDAVKFLQGQCTCDINELEQHRILLGAHCNRQGRMMSSFTLAELTEQAVGLRLRGDIASSTLATMSRYIVFSKATMAPAEHVGLALLGFEADDLPFAQVPPPGEFRPVDGGALLHHTSGLLELWVTPDRALDLWPLLVKQFQPAPPYRLDQHFIEAGIAEVQAATQEEYLPQQFNYQAIGAVNFKKGCYTGQEIVARMQYRGQLKKRCYRLISEDKVSLAALGGALMDTSAEERKVATIVAAAPGQVLAVANDDAASTDAPLLEPSTGTKFTWANLPYAIP